MTEQINSVNLDAAGNAFFERELAVIKSRTYDVVYPALKGTELVPVNTDGGPGAEIIVYRSYSALGLAKIIANYADDLPRADVQGEEFTSPIRSIGASYGYTVQEIRASQLAGKSLEQRKANAARLAMERKINRIIWTGDAEAGLTGFVNNPNVTRVSAPADGSGGATTFASKTPAQILRDLNNLVNNINTLTYGAEAADTLILPLAQYNYLSITPYSTYSDRSILNFFLDNSPFIKRVVWANEMKDAGIGVDAGVSAGEDIAIAFNYDPDKISFAMPVPFEQFPAQERNLEFVINCHARVGGVLIYYPLSVAILEGI